MRGKIDYLMSIPNPTTLILHLEEEQMPQFKFARVIHPLVPPEYIPSPILNSPAFVSGGRKPRKYKKITLSHHFSTNLVCKTFVASRRMF